MRTTHYIVRYGQLRSLEFKSEAEARAGTLHYAKVWHVDPTQMEVVRVEYEVMPTPRVVEGYQVWFLYDGALMPMIWTRTYKTYAEAKVRADDADCLNCIVVKVTANEVYE